MTWAHWLGLALVVTAVVALTGFKPKGTRHVARTKLMSGARIVLVLVAVLLLVVAFLSRRG